MMTENDIITFESNLQPSSQVNSSKTVVIIFPYSRFTDRQILLSKKTLFLRHYDVFILLTEKHSLDNNKLIFSGIL